MSAAPDMIAATGPGPTTSSVTDAVTAAGPRLPLPRVAIQFCTQCKWMLRAAYFAQELLSTFGPALGEVALQPATGGIFTVTIETGSATKLLWDRKSEGGFPETKELKRRVRDVIEPGRDLGHVDRHVKATDVAADASAAASSTAAAVAAAAAASDNSTEVEATGPVCEDCQ